MKTPYPLKRHNPLKSLTTLTSFITLLLLLPLSGRSQCEPMTAEECPDPEENGQVCPDSLEVAYLNQFYSQVATIKTPAVYYQPPDSTVITIHHVKLKEVGNLPPGLTWQSDSPDSVFMAGEFNCVVMEGQPEAAGIYPLAIKVGVSVIPFPGWPPIEVANVTDSTSLSILVVDDSGIHESKEIFAGQNFPNPFVDMTVIPYSTSHTGEATFEVFTLAGQRVHTAAYPVNRGENELIYNGFTLPKGSYFYLVRDGIGLTGGIMVKSGR
ncbi:MAG TPA: T9SS type A sorting domain-containing protein [Bacteroidales bacterium]|nr:T9SS type A sorting domain-containing protein [Bacteroidales bacterium]